MYKGTFFKIFQQIPDDRQEGKVRHSVLDVFFLAITGVICGCNDWKDIHSWAIDEDNHQWLKKHVLLMHGVPSVSTIKRVLYSIEPQEFEELFGSWMNTLIDIAEDDVVSLNGKRVKGSHDRIHGKKGIHMVRALCQLHGLVLDQVEIHKESPEMTAIYDELDRLYLEGCMVTVVSNGYPEEDSRES